MKFGELFKKEVKDAFSDRMFIVLLVISMILIPFIFMNVFVYSFDENVKGLKVVVVDEDNSNYSSQLIDAIKTSKYFEVETSDSSITELKGRLGKDLNGIFQIPSDFEESINNVTRANLFFYIDSSNFKKYHVMETESQKVIQESLKKIVSSIVKEMQEETSENKKINTGIENAIQELNLKIKTNLNDISDLDFDSVISSLGSIKTNILNLRNTCSNCTKTYEDSFTAISLKVDGVIKDLRDLEDEKDSIKSGTIQSSEEVESVKSKLSGIKLDLKSLNQDFLSYPLSLDKQFVFGRISYAKFLIPSIICFGLFFICFIFGVAGGVEKRKEKSEGSFFQRALISFLNILAILFVGFIEVLIIILMSKYLFGVGLSGSLGVSFLVLVLLGLSGIGLGMIFSFLIRNEHHGLFLFPLILISLFFLSGAFSSLDFMPSYIQYASYSSPMLYSNTVLRNVMIQGQGFKENIYMIAYLLTYAVFSLVIGYELFRHFGANKKTDSKKKNVKKKIHKVKKKS